MKDMERSRNVARPALIASVVATPSLTYWLVGDLSEDGDDYHLDYMRRSAISERVASFLGVVSLLVVVASSVVLWRNRRVVHGSARSIAGLCTAVGVIVGSGYRVTTAGGSGANIGGGLIILVGTPVCVFLLAAAAIIGFTSRRRA